MQESDCRNINPRSVPFDEWTIEEIRTFSKQGELSQWEIRRLAVEYAREGKIVLIE